MQRINSATGLTASKLVDHHSPSQSDADPPRDQEQPDELQRAFAELKAAFAETMDEVEMHLDQNRGLVVVTIREKGARRVLRQILPEELFRLVRLIRSGRTQFLDRLI